MRNMYEENNSNHVSEDCNKQHSLEISKDIEICSIKKDKKIKVRKIIGITIVVIIVAIAINFIPRINLKTKDMKEVHGDWIDMYYEKEEEAAEDVFQYINSNVEEVVKKFRFAEKPDVKVFLYDKQKTMQKKKYGFIGSLLNLEWYIGDNIGTDVIFTSPVNAGEIHDYNEIKEAVLHEIVHAYVSVKNDDIQLWLTEGMALYLTNGEPFYKEYIEKKGIPSYEDTCTNSPLRFNKCNGYSFAHAYIEYIDKTYGWDKVLKLIETEDYEDIFNKSKKEIYNEWVNYIENYYR